MSNFYTIPILVAILFGGTLKLGILELILLPPFLLALPIGIIRRSWRRFIEASLLSLFGIWVPLVVFILRFGFGPNWKGGSPYGWLGSFQQGSIALLPLVLFACSGFYRYAIVGRFAEPPKWAIISIFCGQVVSAGCLCIDLILLSADQIVGLIGIFVVPVYVVIGYAWMCVRIIRRDRERLKLMDLTLIGTTPFWAANLFVSKNIYDRLPENPPDCFVVTAATHGHSRIVGPLMEIERHGRRRLANNQLMTFWLLEGDWKSCSPKTHRLFRRQYNWVAPIIAKRISDAPWRADCTYLLLKPAELVARLVLRRKRRA